MSDTPTDKQVSIDQLPEYRQAVKQIIAMPKKGPQFQRLAEDLGMAGDFFKADAVALSLDDKTRDLSQAQKKLDERAAQFEKHDRTLRRDDAIAGITIQLGGVLTAGIGWYKRSISALKVTAIVVGTFLIGTLVSLGGVGKFFGADEKKSDTLKPSFARLSQEKQQLAKEKLELSALIVNEMATKMVEQQKMLVGEGVDMKLVSSAGAPAPAASQASGMAEKYAVPPAASYADATGSSQEAPVSLRR